ncbi:P-loop containing nucleoside triphosphate hydrolase protein [Chytridium lagenaria]|nr:P-loop containing nucleoside triphosphate hydrolase protein [Chytridium lagenaria]
MEQHHKTTRQILKNLTGTIKSGEMVAIMGSSGAGKTTLLNCLSGRLSTGILSGSILYNGTPRDPKTWKKTMSFVEQDDVLYSQITVRETLRYAARLRLPSSDFTKEEKYRRADDILKSLRLSKAADTQIGDETAIGQELVGNPEILFLDEPTSGLDSNSALAVMDNVKQDAKNSGRIVISTIHQPSFELLSLFDTVILLSGGSTVYMGSPHDAIDYFAALTRTPPISSWISSPSTPPNPTTKLGKTMNESTIQKAFIELRGRVPVDPKAGSYGAVRHLDKTETVEDILDRDDHELTIKAGSTGPVKKLHWSNSWLEELAILTQRSWIQFVRGRDVIIAYFARTVILVLLIGFTFYRMKNDQNSIQNRLGILFFWPVNQVFNTILPILGVFPLERVIMIRERSTRSYRVSSFFLSKVITEIIPNTFFTLFGCIPLYFMMGLRTDDQGLSFVRFLVIQWVEVLVCIAVGFLIGASVPVVQLAQIIGPLVGVVFLLYGGSLLNNDDLPIFFRGLQYVSPVNYAYRANMFNELQGFKLVCSPDPTLPCFKTGEQVLKQFSLTSYTLWDVLALWESCLLDIFLLGTQSLESWADPRPSLFEIGSTHIFPSFAIYYLSLFIIVFHFAAFNPAFNPRFQVMGKRIFLSAILLPCRTYIRTQLHTQIEKAELSLSLAAFPYRIPIPPKFQLDPNLSKIAFR